MAPTQYKLIFFAPLPAVAACKAAVFATGAGRYPAPNADGVGYSECCFVTRGQGQFRPSSAANPALGARNQVNQVEEAKVEVVCSGEDVARAAVAAMKRLHPYEVPAYEVYKIEDF